jgi:hypothetical protein
MVNTTELDVAETKDRRFAARASAARVAARQIVIEDSL